MNRGRKYGGLARPDSKEMAENIKMISLTTGTVGNYKRTLIIWDCFTELFLTYSEVVRGAKSMGSVNISLPDRQKDNRQN